MATLVGAVLTEGTFSTDRNGVALPVGFQEDDVAFFSWVTANTHTINSLSGATQIGTTESADESMSLAYLVLTGSEGGTVDFPGLFTTAESGSTLCVVYRGLDVADLIGDNAQANLAVAGTATSGPSITPPNDDSLILQWNGVDPGSPVMTEDPLATKIFDGKDAGSFSYYGVQAYEQETAAAIALDASFTESLRYMYFQFAVNNAVTGPTVTQTDDTPEDGVEQTYTTTGLTGTITANTLAGFSLLPLLSDTDPTTPTDYTLDISALPFNTSLGLPRVGEPSTLSVTATGGTATTDVTIQPATGYAAVTLEAPLNKDANGLLDVLETLYGITINVGDIIYYSQSYGENVTVNGYYTGGSLANPGEFTHILLQQGGSETTTATTRSDPFYPFGQADAPDQFDLGPDVIDAEPNAVIDRSFVVAGLDAPQTFNATGSGLVSLTAGSGYGASVEADTGDTVYFRLVADSGFNTLVSGGVTCNGVSDSVDVTTRVQEAPVLPATLTLFGAVDQPFFTVLNAYLSDGDLPTAWAKVGGADEAQYTLNNDSTFSRDVDQDTEESEVVDVQASNAAGSSGTMVVTIQYTEQAAGSDTLLVARTLRARTL